MIRSGSDEPVSSTQPTEGTYIALGDSVAAGVGLKDYSDSSACDRTRQSYPEVLAKALNYRLTHVACSGAKTTEGLIGRQTVNNLALPPQIEALQSDNRPDLVTITIGANDANWTTYLTKCYTAVCGSQADTDGVAAGVVQAATNLDRALRQIQSTYPSETPRVVVTGYYRLFPDTPASSSACTELSGIEPAELAWIRQLQDTIDDALRATAAKYAFARFVPVDFGGHELCTDDPWIQGIGAKAPYHPTEAGQAAIARQIRSALGL
jgi:lysophospholipase L1-like esterase